MNTDQPTTIKQTIQAAFQLAADAAKLRDTLATQLPRAVGRDHGIGHRCYCTLSDLIVGFQNVEDQIASMRSVEQLRLRSRLACST